MKTLLLAISLTIVAFASSATEMSAYDKAVIAGSGTQISEFTGVGKQAIALANIYTLANNQKMTVFEFIKAFNKHIPKEADYNLALSRNGVILILPNGSQRLLYSEDRGLTPHGKKFSKELTAAIHDYVEVNHGDVNVRPIVTVPEPSSILMMGLAVVLLAFSTMRTNRKHNV